MDFGAAQSVLRNLRNLWFEVLSREIAFQSFFERNSYAAADFAMGQQNYFGPRVVLKATEGGLGSPSTGLPDHDCRISIGAIVAALRSRSAWVKKFTDENQHATDRDHSADHSSGKSAERQNFFE
jgi:hypothetical protein